MKVMINGNEIALQKEVTVSSLLEIRKVKTPDMVSVELNGEILSRSSFDRTFVKEGDAVEFLYFMGGGAEQWI